MKNALFTGAASAVLAALAIGLTAPATADPGDGTLIAPPGGPVEIYPHFSTGGANPNTPFGPDPYIPYSVAH